MWTQGGSQLSYGRKANSLPPPALTHRPVIHSLSVSDSRPSAFCNRGLASPHLAAVLLFDQSYLAGQSGLSGCSASTFLLRHRPKLSNIPTTAGFYCVLSASFRILRHSINEKERYLDSLCTPANETGRVDMLMILVTSLSEGEAQVRFNRRCPLRTLTSENCTGRSPSSDIQGLRVRTCR